MTDLLRQAVLHIIFNVCENLVNWLVRTGELGLIDALAMLRNSLKGQQNGNGPAGSEHLDSVPHVFTVLGASVSFSLPYFLSYRIMGNTHTHTWELS